ncbi:MAG TPA: hypothetical protein DD618_04685 [Acholeplasmatales bacterium]|nr:hypothetical protein [Acholeplasmatales bacterium]
MNRNLSIRCRKVSLHETRFYSFHETVFNGEIDVVIQEVFQWYNKNIKYYDLKENWERKTVPVVSFGTFMFFLICSVISRIENPDSSEKTTMNIEINEDCVYISGRNTKTDFQELTKSLAFIHFWEQFDDKTFDVNKFLDKEYNHKKIIFVYNSIYLNYKDYIRGKKFYLSENEEVNEKELLIKETLKKYPQSSSLEISKYTGIPQRTVRFYLNSMEFVQSNCTSRNSPKRVYSLMKGESAKTRQKNASGDNDKG